MMISGVKPIDLPISHQEASMIEARQRGLARSIEKVKAQVLNHQISKGEGQTRINFLKSEIDQLELHKRTRRIDPPTKKWTTAPRVNTRQRVTRKPAKKYVSSSRRTITEAKSPHFFRVKNPMTRTSITMKKPTSVVRSSRRSRPTPVRPTIRRTTAKPTQRVTSRSVPKKTTEQAEAVGKNKRGYIVAQYYSAIRQDYINRRGRAPSTGYASYLKRKAADMHKRNYPLPKVVPKRRAPPSRPAAKPAPKKTSTSIMDRMKKALTDSRKSNQSKPSPAPRKPTTRSTKTSSTSTASKKPTYSVTQNPYGTRWGKSLTFRHKMVMRIGKFSPKKASGYYYGPKEGKYSAKWKAWNKSHGIAGISNIGGLSLQEKAAVATQREMALAKRRAGARIPMNVPYSPNDDARAPVKVPEETQATEQIEGLGSAFVKTKASMERLLGA